MKTVVKGSEVFASTGGREFDPKGSALVFIHGSGQSHLSFMLQGRFFANRGWQVLAPDMPAHGLSDGSLLTSIEEMADWHADYLKELGVAEAHIIGHSQGGLVGLELARRHPKMVSGLSMVATALAIPVNEALLDMAKNKEPAAIDAMVDWGHGQDGHMHDHTMPGQNHMNYGKQLMAANETGALYADLAACAAYIDGKAAASALTCPAQCILAERDKMTPVRAGLKMAEALGVSAEIIPKAGHMLPSESPFEVNKALRPFFKKG